MTDKTGMLVPPKDVEAMAKVLNLYVQNPDLCHEHGSVGRTRALNEFSVQTMVKSYLSIYDGLLSDTEKS